jgi:hypothetical protein
VGNGLISNNLHLALGDEHGIRIICTGFTFLYDLGRWQPGTARGYSLLSPALPGGSPGHVGETFCCRA